MSTGAAAELGVETPTTPAEAVTRLEQRSSDRDWAAKLLSGHVDVTREFHALTELASSGDDIDRAISGNISDKNTGVTTGELVEMRNVAGMLRDRDIPPEVIREQLSDKPVSQAEHDLTARWKKEKMADREFTAAFLRGEPDAVRRLTLADMILSREIA